MSMPTLSSATLARILAEVQKNPEISTANATYVSRLIQNAAHWIAAECRLPRFPELSRGYAKSAVSPGTYLTALATNELWVSVNGSTLQKVSVTLANCDSGVNTAAELQTQIRAVSVVGFEEVAVAYDATSGAEYYTITSGRYGESSQIFLSFNDWYEDVCRTMLLTSEYGGTAYRGGTRDDELEALCALVVETMYAKVGAEGLQSASLPGGISFSSQDLDRGARSLLYSKRRMW